MKSPKFITRMTAVKGLLPAVLLLAACDTSPLEVNPGFEVPNEQALSTPAGLAAGVRGIYDALQQTDAYDRNLIVYPDLYADNLEFTGTFDTDAEVDDGNVTPANTTVEGIWSAGYDLINRANNVLAAIPNVAGVDATTASQFTGEALFLRALTYHNLVRWFGGLPILLQPTWEITPGVNVPRNPEAEVYARIEADLLAAIPQLPTTSAVFGATRGAAQALLARVYLDEGKSAEARDMATTVIGSNRYQLITPYSNIWAVKNSPESIFSVQYTVNDDNFLAFWFFPSALGGRRGFAPTANLRTTLINDGDVERLNTTVALSGTRRYGNKYFRVATGDDNIVVLRIAEMYLIRAEANWRLNAPAATILADVNAVRRRAGVAELNPLTVTTPTALRDAILLERRLEFALEGQRFFDLRRILGPAAAAVFLGLSEFRMFFPIPQRELDANTALAQNSGY
jgi:starch-binding outer membrane protein, SusD/RagB family